MPARIPDVLNSLRVFGGGFICLPCEDGLNTFLVEAWIPGFPNNVCIGQIVRKGDGWAKYDVIRQGEGVPDSRFETPMAACAALRKDFLEVLEWSRRCQKFLSDEGYKQPEKGSGK